MFAPCNAVLAGRRPTVPVRIVNLSDAEAVEMFTGGLPRAILASPVCSSRFSQFAVHMAWKRSSVRSRSGPTNSLRVFLNLQIIASNPQISPDTGLVPICRHCAPICLRIRIFGRHPQAEGLVATRSTFSTLNCSPGEDCRQSGSYVVSDEPLSPEESSVLSPVWSTDLIPVDGCCSKRPDTLRQSA